MEFKARIHTKHGAAISTSPSTAGMILVDEGRKRFSLPNLSAEVFDDEIVGYHADISTTLTEEMARASGHFSNASLIRIECPHGYLNQFVNNVIMTKVDDDGAVTRVWLVPTCDEAAVIEAWKDAGYPLKWGFIE